MIDGKMMLQLVLKRQSDRKYSDKPVEDDKIRRIITAARMSPSACNAQPWKFITVTDKNLIQKLAEAASAGTIGMNKFVNQAPLLLVIVREKANLTSKIGSTIKNKDYSRIDIGIAACTICLQASSEGLGSCMIGWFNEKSVRSILSIPASKRVELLITIGYSLSETREKKRKPADVTTSCNRY